MVVSGYNCVLCLSGVFMLCCDRQEWMGVLERERQERQQNGGGNGGL